MPYIRLKDYTLLSGWTNFAADDYLYAADHSDSDREKKIYFSHLKDYVLEGKVVGGGNAGDIVNNNSTQTLSGKTLNGGTLNSPTINTPQISGATLTGATVLPASTTIGAVSPTELSYLDGLTSNVQTQINNLGSSMLDIIIATLTVGITFTQATGVTIKDISQAAILAAASISGSQYVIDDTCIGLHLYLIQESNYEVVPFTAAGTFMKFTKQRINEQDQLDIISISGLTAEKSYIAVIQFKINPKTGV